MPDGRSDAAGTFQSMDLWQRTVPKLVAALDDISFSRLQLLCYLGRSCTATKKPEGVREPLFLQKLFLSS